MEENQEGPNGYLEKLALITDAIESIFTNAQVVLVFELEENDYRKMQSHFRKIDSIHDRFKIDISGVEVIFMIKGYIKAEPEKEEIKEKIIEKKNIFQRISDLLSGKKSS